MKHRLTPTDRRIWQILTNMEGAPISTLDLAEKTNSSRTTVTSAIRKLLELGVIDRRESGAKSMGVPNSYKILQSPESFDSSQKEPIRWWWMFGDEVCLQPEHLFNVYRQQDPENARALRPEEAHRLWLAMARRGLIKTENGTCVVRRVGNSGVSLHVLALTDAGCRMLAGGFAEHLIERSLRVQAG